MFTTRELAEAAGVHIRTVQRLVARGALTPLKNVGTEQRPRWLFRASTAAQVRWLVDNVKRSRRMGRWELISAAEAARRAGVSRQTVHNWIEANDLLPHRAENRRGVFWLAEDMRRLALRRGHMWTDTPDEVLEG